MLKNNRYHNKVALVTGGARGIGRAVVEPFLSEGARVIVCDINADAKMRRDSPNVLAK